MSTPTISVILPTYNRPDKLRDAIQSAADQTYSNIEIVVVDDGSDEEYVYDVVNSFSKSDNIQIRQHNKNRGVAAARNTGLDSASGELIAFLDDDDVWKPKKIEKQVHAMLSEDRPICYTWMDRVDENGNVTGGWRPTESGMIHREDLDSGLPGPPAFCYRMEVLNEVGGFDESLPILEDVDLGMRLLGNYEYACVPQTLVLAQVTGEPTSERVQNKKRAVEYLLNKYKSRYEQSNPKSFRSFKSDLYSGLGMSALKAGEYSLARRSYFVALKEQPQISKELLYALTSLGGPFTHEPARFIKRKLFDSRIK